MQVSDTEETMLIVIYLGISFGYYSGILNVLIGY
jgi:hypothetical protein